MFTLKFIGRGREVSFSVVRYETSYNNDSKDMEVLMSRKLSGMNEFCEYVGEGVDSEFTIAYVTNSEGKTIDVVRPPKNLVKA